jgi:hypothetical protein
LLSRRDAKVWRAVAFGLVALSLGGCVTDRPPGGLGFLVGQNVQVMVDRLAPVAPDQATTATGDTVYTWFDQPVPINYWSADWRSALGQGESMPICTVSLTVDHRGIIRSWRWRSNREGGCAHFMKVTFERQAH